MKRFIQLLFIKEILSSGIVLFFMIFQKKARIRSSS